jgi:hypothetical protein
MAALHGPTLCCSVLPPQKRGAAGGDSDDEDWSLGKKGKAGGKGGKGGKVGLCCSSTRF